ncbi:MAG: hypothetical protein KAS75_08525 [Planctomycetes bacterium]|nr:hypothetical protein [Planctomycetota bacterium]
MKKIFMLFIVAALFCPAAFSATKTVVRETKGHGVNRDEAIKKALAQAVAQVRGVKVSSGDYEFGYQSATADIDREEGSKSKSVEFDAVSVRTGGSVLKTETEGLVKTYEVLNEKKIDETTYEVTLKVWVYEYEAPDKTDRLKLAVMPVGSVYQQYRFGELVLSAGEISHKLTHQLSVLLTGTNKFAVLDRDNFANFMHEKAILTYDASLEEKAKLGQVLGSDYTLVGSISSAAVTVKEKTSAAIGHPIREYEADFVLDYRLLVGPTRQVKLAGIVNISLETKDVKKLVKKWEPEDLDYRELVDNLIARVAEQVVENIIDQMYPIRIASIDGDGQIIINQGGKRIAEGMILEVYSEGKEIIDVDTKESLGKTETLIAKIKVDNVSLKISYAKLIDGDLSKLSEGLICRRQEAKGEILGGRKSNIQRSSKGGVKLPFD